MGGKKSNIFESIGSTLNDVASGTLKAVTDVTDEVQRDLTTGPDLLNAKEKKKQEQRDQKAKEAAIAKAEQARLDLIKSNRLQESYQSGAKVKYGSKNAKANKALVSSALGITAKGTGVQV